MKREKDPRFNIWSLIYESKHYNATTVILRFFALYAFTVFFSDIQYVRNSAILFSICLKNVNIAFEYTLVIPKRVITLIFTVQYYYSLIVNGDRTTQNLSMYS